MEWSNYEYSPLEESLQGYVSPQFELEKQEWTFEDNKLFENALAELDPFSPDFFENIASKVPWKTIDDIKTHYQALVDDVAMIESDNFPIPDYPNVYDDQEKQVHDHHINVAKKDEGESSNEAKVTKNGKQRRRGVPWTEEEHRLFLMGMNKFGQGDWRSISRYYVNTKTPTQVASHAQKYFRRQTSSTPVERRRRSIHDVQNVNLNTLTSSVPPNQMLHEESSFPSHSLVPMVQHSYNSVVDGQNSMFLPMNSTFDPPNDHHI